MLQKIKEFESYLISEEKSKATVMKYTHDVTAFIQWLNGQQISKAVVQEYKQWLESEYAPKSVNSILSSLNSFFEWMDHPEYRVKSLKIQQNAFIEPNRELTKAEYDMLLKTAYEQGKNTFVSCNADNLRYWNPCVRIGIHNSGCCEKRCCQN